MTFTIRPYRAADEPSLLSCWNATLWADPIDARTWRLDFLLDPRFDPATCLVAEEGHDLVGFCFGMRSGSGEDAAVVAFGVRSAVRRQGIGTALLNQVIATWEQVGVARVAIGPYVPTYIAPGVDEIAYPEAIAFLTARGSSLTSRPLSMRAVLMGYRTADDIVERADHLTSHGLMVRAVRADDILPVREFLRAQFPEWQGEVSEVLADLCVGDSGRCTLQVAERDGEIVGFAQSRGERFGPFGVHDQLRGQGVGAVLLDRTLLAMRSRGFHVAWFLWTDERAARLYRQFGFDEVRRFSLFTRRP